MDQPDAWKQTPLQHPAQDRRTDVVEVILGSGHQMDLISAISPGSNDLVAKMIRDNPSAINGRQNSPEKPLMTAVRRGEEKIVELLLNAGAEVNEKYSLGARSGPPHCGMVTALSIAVVLRKTEFIELLIPYGVDPHHRNAGQALPPVKSARP